ncbi:hypothetical protein [Prevotella sp.]|uniref:hypothetical protein n=1 Tax=Prevotella sp. TaxID=59823 RepID=UPI0025D279FD|nr:hypothetical protein [Prevotella sp.]
MKDQQMNNIGTQEEVNNATQWQENAQQDGNNVPSPGKNEGAGKDGKPLTTEQFHTLLKFNTIELSGARTAYATEISDLKQEYDDTLTAILEKEQLANIELRAAREEFEIAKEKYEQTLRDLKKERNEAGRKQNVGKAEAKNRWSSANEEIQAKRHDIFEWYRNSGGTLTGAEEGLLHPGWARDKKGGMSDE